MVYHAGGLYVRPVSKDWLPVVWSLGSIRAESLDIRKISRALIPVNGSLRGCSRGGPPSGNFNKGLDCHSG